MLSWIGSLPVMDPFLGLGQNLSFLYFLIFLLFFPLGGPIERLIYDSYIFLSQELDFISLYYHNFRREMGVKSKA
jgi:Fe2+ transport system protein B